MKSNVFSANLLKRSKKSRLLLNNMLHMLQSRLCQFLCLLMVSVLLTVRNTYRRTSLSAYLSVSPSLWLLLLCLPAAMLAMTWRQLVFETFLVMHRVEAALGLFKWHSVVDEQLLLGAIPMADQWDEFQKLNIAAVISVVQPWELEMHTLFGSPISSEQWKRAGIHHYVLPCTDFVPPPFEVLDEGAKILDRYLANNNRVYVHCKSGIGRSASVVLAYFLKFKGEDLITLHQKLRLRRSVVFTERSSQMKNMQLYQAHNKAQ